MTPSLPNDTEQLTNPISVDVPLDTSPSFVGQSSCPEPEEHQDVGGTPLSNMPCVTITTIIATGLTFGLRRIPAGFYVQVQADNIQWQTTNKTVLVDQDVLEWNQRIVLPSETSCKIQLRVYASYEMYPILGHGDLLRTFETSVGDLLDRSENSRPFSFQPNVGEVISPCTSLFTKTEQSLSCEADVNVLHPITLSALHDIHELQLLADAGHRMIGRYHRTEDKKDLDQSIVHFERSLDLCPIDHPCRPAALVNLAIAKFTRCQFYAIHLDFDVSISLFQDALDLRPTGHPDRASTQLYLAIAFLSRFAERGLHADADAAEEMLTEVLNNSHARSYIYRSATIAIETYILHQPGETVDAILADKPISSMLPLSVNELVRRSGLCVQTDDPHALDEAISLHYEALKYYSATQSDRQILLNNLGCVVHIRFKRRGSDKDLDEAIVLHREALTLRPVGHPDRPQSLNNLAHALHQCFQHRGGDKDLDEAIVLNREALTLRPVGHLERHSSLNSLANVVIERFNRRGGDEDLDEAITLHSEALSLRPDGHPDRPKSLNNVASVLFWRFSHRGDDKDLDEAIMLYREALALRPVDHPDWSESLNNLAVVLRERFQHKGSDEDLDEAIVLHKEALNVCPVGHSGRPSSLNNLANVVIARFKRHSSDKDLDEAIAFHREALTLRPVGHPDRPSSLNNLANVMTESFKHQGSDKDLDEAIALHREALTLHPVDHPARHSSLNSLANSLHVCYEHRGSDKDLDEAVVLHREALTLHPVGHPYRHLSLNNLANALYMRFQHRGSNEDLNEAIILHREALTLCPIGHPHRPSSLNNLASTLHERFQCQGSNKDLDEAIMLNREALTLLSIDHLDRPLSLINLAGTLNERFQSRGSDEDLDDAIMLNREALTLFPVGHPYRPLSLNNLASILDERFQHRGSDQDLDEAIVLNREALTLFPVGHPVRPMSLNTLANALFRCFLHRGSDKDLDEAIVLHREALVLHPVGHSIRPKSLNNLAGALYERFLHRGSDKDLDEAIILHRETLTLRPVGHPDRPSSLANLANILDERFQDQGSNNDLDEAILLHREGLTLISVDHLDRPSSLNNLASALHERFQHGGGSVEDLDEAIVLHREALTLRPAGSSDRPSSLIRLANSLRQRFEHQGSHRDLDDAQAYACSALTLLKAHDPNIARANEVLADIHLSLHRSSPYSIANDTDDLNAAIRHLKVAVSSVSRSPLYRFRSSMRWVGVAEQYKHDTLLEAYTTSIQHLDTHMSAIASVSSRHRVILKSIPLTFAVNPASIALQNGEVSRAVELLEQGRTLIWAQMARFRTPLDTLQEHNSHTEALVKKFRELSSVLNRSPELGKGTPRVEEEAEAVRYSRLMDEWNSVVEEIRKVDGFSRFMLPPLFSDLQDAARDGPVIILITSSLSCDAAAIIVAHQHSPVSVRLGTNLEKLRLLVVAFQSVVRNNENREKLVEALRGLWADIVCPVVENLAGLAKPGSRIWWCPTSLFNFMPLHAAGEYKRGGKNLSSLYVSSYTPSLTALIRARRRHNKSQPSLFAAIGQNHPPGYESTLESVEPELDLVHNLLPPSPTVCRFTKVTSIESTKSRALRALQDNHWLHIACHGIQAINEPFNSAFLMRDQPLTLLDITQADLSKHQYAFLSACDTALGVPESPDEIIHLAAALQFAGVKSVIGTFWSVEDFTVGRLIEEFYKNFCGDGKMNAKRAARSLHKAVQSLANDKEIPLEQRIVFMHIGI